MRKYIMIFVFGSFFIGVGCKERSVSKKKVQKCYRYVMVGESLETHLCKKARWHNGSYVKKVELIRAEYCYIRIYLSKNKSLNKSKKDDGSFTPAVHCSRVFYENKLVKPRDATNAEKTVLLLLGLYKSKFSIFKGIRFVPDLDIGPSTLISDIKSGINSQGPLRGKDLCITYKLRSIAGSILRVYSCLKQKPRLLSQPRLLQLADQCSLSMKFKGEVKALSQSQVVRSKNRSFYIFMSDDFFPDQVRAFVKCEDVKVFGRSSLPLFLKNNPGIKKF